MVNTPANPGPFDPLADADPNAPFFPLMATDRFAPKLVLRWADEVRTYARTVEDKEERKRLFDKCNEAEEIAWAMQRYQQTGTAEDAQVDGKAASYGIAHTEHRWKKHLIDGVTELRNTAYNFDQAAELIGGDMGEALRAVVAQANAIAEAYRPKRASYADEPELPLTAAEAGIAV